MLKLGNTMKTACTSKINDLKWSLKEEKRRCTMYYYAGVDYHRRFNYLTAMDEKSKILKEKKFPNTKEAMHTFLRDTLNGSSKQIKAVLEVGKNRSVMYDLLKEELGEIKLAHSYKIKAIASAKIKTNKIDSRILTHLLRANLIPEVYVPPKDTRKVKNILRQRMFFIRLRTMLKNRIYMILERHSEIKDRPQLTDLFGRTSLLWLKNLKISNPDNKLLKESLELLDNFNIRISKTEHLVEKLSKKHPYVKRLLTIPIGKFFSVSIAYEVENIKRFPNEKKFTSYIGIIPSAYASGTFLRLGRIICQGNRYLRWAFIEAIWPAVNKSNYLKTYYQRIRNTKGANKAKVATARRLTTIIYKVISENRDYIERYPAASY
jgi:transposase